MKKELVDQSLSLAKSQLNNYKSTLKDSIDRAERIHNTTYTFNEEKAQKIMKEIQAEIREKEIQNQRMPTLEERVSTLEHKIRQLEDTIFKMRD